MNYSEEEVLQFVEEEDVQFVRLAFCDVFGRPKNISIMASELPRAFHDGIAFDASAIKGFGDETRSDLFLHPDPQTLSILPWRPEQGRVIRMYCTIHRPDGSPFEADPRTILLEAVKRAADAGYEIMFGAEAEFYLLNRDENGKPTKEPYDDAGYLDLAPDDKGENIRRQICLTLMQMGVHPECSHHEEGPGQNEIDFRYSDAVTAADNLMTVRTVIRTVAESNGVYADFSPKPLKNQPGNGLHVNLSVVGNDESEPNREMLAGVLKYMRDMTVFLNPLPESYLRFGSHKAPKYISWSHENRSQLVRIPASGVANRRVELRSPDSACNPYIVYALIIHAALEGILGKWEIPPETDMNFFSESPETLSKFRTLPRSLTEAAEIARKSSFIRAHLPAEVIEAYTNNDRE